MSQQTGMLSLEDLRAEVTAQTIDTVLVVFTDLYGRFMGKRYDAEFFLDAVAQAGTHSCDYLFTVDMEMEPVTGYAFANWERGYGDVHLVPDLSTLRRAAWLEKSALVLCDVENERTHQPVEIAPRTLLRQQVERARQMGYTPMAGSELEYYIFGDSYMEAARKGYANLAQVGWYLEDYHILQGSREEGYNAAVRRALKASGVPVENTKGEFGVGQHELNVHYTDVLNMADRHAIYKQCLKEVADQQGLSVTFMAKIDRDQAGSSCHLHLSLWDESGNAFPGEEPIGPIQASPLFRWFLAGWIAHVPDLMVFYAPTVNSYKRFQSGSWAPTKRAWSYDNRTAGFRVVGRGKSLRIECRIPGADCNPYLAYAAALASGLAGIEQQMEPPALFDGDIYSAADLPGVPASLREATDLFEASDFAAQVFGPEVVAHYTHFFRTEQRQFDEAVTDWERRRYFERI
jgi:glutamine synthetase